MAEATFNRELGAAPAGISRFGQIRTDNGSNVTINSYRSFAGDGSYPLADVFEVTYGASGTATFLLDAEAFGVSGITVVGSDGVEDGTAKAPKKTRRSSSGVAFSVTSGDTATLYVNRTDRSAAEYRVTAFVVP
jgi:hypothetical protein